MGDKSAIEWTEATWNPVTGCTKVSPGCKHCYAETMAHRLQKMGQANYRNGFALTLQPHMLQLPLTWKNPRTIFVNSMSDLFHKDVHGSHISNVFGVMAVAATKFGGRWQKDAGWVNQHGPHTFQLLTKRSDRMREALSSRSFRLAVAASAYRYAHDRVDAGWLSQCISGEREWGNNCTLDEMWPLPNVWLGTSVENQDYAHRIADLQATPAAVRFLSLEPLLGPLPGLDLEGIHWVIAGGESGPGARPMDPDWVRDIRDQCRRAGVALFVKQMGSVWARENGCKGKGGDLAALPEDLRIRQMPEARP